MSISSNWRHYFKDPHEGLGTTYERFILHRYFEKIRETFSVMSIVESPSFGMTGISGINSMWWARQRVSVTVVDDQQERIDHIKKVWQDASLEADFVQCPNYTVLPFEENAFDLSWNFASLWFVPDLERFLEELTRVTRKVIFVCVPNRFGLGYIARRLIGNNHAEGLHYDNICPGRIKESMLKLRWNLFDEGFFDVPPWPDIAMKKEDLLEKIGLKWLAGRMGRKGDDGICILDYYSGKNKGMDKAVLKYAFLEDSPWIVKRFWAHHWYAIFISH